MSDALRIRRVRFVAATANCRSPSVLGYASCSINGLGRLDGIAVRRVGSGSYAIALPSRRDGSGRRHLYFKPRTTAVRDSIEAQVLGELMRRGELP